MMVITTATGTTTDTVAATGEAIVAGTVAIEEAIMANEAVRLSFLLEFCGLCLELTVSAQARSADR